MADASVEAGTAYLARLLDRPVDDEIEELARRAARRAGARGVALSPAHRAALREEAWRLERSRFRWPDLLLVGVAVAVLVVVAALVWVGGGDGRAPAVASDPASTPAEPAPSRDLRDATPRPPSSVAPAPPSASAPPSSSTVPSSAPPSSTTRPPSSGGDGSTTAPTDLPPPTDPPPPPDASATLALGPGELDVTGPATAAWTFRAEGLGARSAVAVVDLRVPDGTRAALVLRDAERCVATPLEGGATVVCRLAPSARATRDLVVELSISLATVGAVTLVLELRRDDGVVAGRTGTSGWLGPDLAAGARTTSVGGSSHPRGHLALTLGVIAARRPG